VGRAGCKSYWTRYFRGGSPAITARRLAAPVFVKAPSQFSREPDPWSRPASHCPVPTARFALHRHHGLSSSPSLNLVVCLRCPLSGQAKNACAPQRRKRLCHSAVLPSTAILRDTRPLICPADCLLVALDFVSLHARRDLFCCCLDVQKGAMYKKGIDRKAATKRSQ
jgi:hypothetical protein